MRVGRVGSCRRKFRALGLCVGVEQARRRSGDEPVVVATPQTLRGARLTRFARDAFGLVVIDEAQRVPSTTHQAILDHFAEAPVLGATATPQRRTARRSPTCSSRWRFAWSSARASRADWRRSRRAVSSSTASTCRAWKCAPATIDVGLPFGVVGGWRRQLGVPLLAVPPRRWQRPLRGPRCGGAYVAMRRDGRRCRQVLEVRSLGAAAASGAHAIHDGCGSFAAGPLGTDGRSRTAGRSPSSRSIRTARGW
ncbi:MAG: hypothetical protein E6J90_16060 [Deltaproteobacteria bacterium]|nr:MAG: hypothetical protein E6J90_16060 [Deltaproteobacteria bacterium]